jgi:hypothetical protein
VTIDMHDDPSHEPPHDPADLAAVLRRAASGERPAYSTAVEDRILRSVHVSRPLTASRRSTRDLAAAVGFLLAAMAACVPLALTIGPIVPETAPGHRPSSAVAMQEMTIDQLPFPEEIGAVLLAQTAAIAAEAAGLPRWSELVSGDLMADGFGAGTP